MKTFTPTSLHNSKLQAFVLTVTWILVQFFLLRHFGIVTGYEAKKYIVEADIFLQHGTYSTPNFLFYSTEILLIAGCKTLGLGFGGVVVVQLVANAASTVFFYRLIRQLTSKANVAFFFTLALIGMFYYQLYNVHLFTESLYFSVSIMFFYRLCRIRHLRLSTYVEIVAFLLLLYFTRPVGLFFVPAVFVFLVLKFYRKKAALLFSVAGAVLLLCFVILLNFGMSSGGEFNFLLPYVEGQVICGVPSPNRNAISVPVEQNSVQGLFYLVTHYSGLFFTLFFQRLVAFFGVIRPFYSLQHNLFVALFFYPCYLLAVIGIRRNFATKKAELTALLLLVFFSALTAGLSCDEWHNRFIYAVLPLIMIIASLAFAKTGQTPAQR
jgi:hypothetical protein